MTAIAEIDVTKLEEGDIIHLKGRKIHLLEAWESDSGWRGLINGPKDGVAKKDCEEARLEVTEENGKSILIIRTVSYSQLSGQDNHHRDPYEIVKIQKGGCKKRVESFERYQEWLNTIYDRDGMTFEEASTLLKPIENDQLCLKTAIAHSGVEDAIKLGALMHLAGLSLTEKQFSLFRDHTYIH